MVLATPASAPTPSSSLPTRARRDPTLDVARAGALVVVVAWHWLFSIVSVDADGPHVSNPVGVVPGLWALTWVLQVMPLFFLVGGAVNASALDGRGPRHFVRRRLRRLLVPALPLVVPAVAVLVWASISGHAAVAGTVLLILSPLWFLATYAALGAIAPLAWRAQRRFPVATPVALALTVVTIDVARFVGGWSHPLFVTVSFIVVWAAVHQLGFAWSHLRRAPRRWKALTALAGYGGMALCVFALGYPASMVGVFGDPVSNMSPPDLMAVLLGVGQLGLLALVADRLELWVERHRALVGTASAWSMTVFVWHLLAWFLAYLVVRRAGLNVPSEPEAAWWIQRPLWIIAPALVAAPLCAVFHRFDAGR